METKYKVEGDKVIFAVSESKSVDSDNDGEASIKASLQFSVEADGSELLEEVLKSNVLAQKAKEYLIKYGIIKA